MREQTQGKAKGGLRVRLSNGRVSVFEKMRGTAAAGNAGVASSERGVGRGWS